MSWIYENTLNWMQRVCFDVVKCGAVPRHIAIIMDGNRRFARKNRVQKMEGHTKGFHKLAETLRWCLDLGVFEITVYAFSIENFKRTKEEVDILMDLAKEKFKILIDEWKKLREHGVCVRAIGNLSLLPREVLTLLLMAMLLTKDNTRGYFYLALSYTGREEMGAASKALVHALADNNIKESDVNEKLVERCFYTYQCSDPDILIRTSGALRFSDFLTWQCSNGYLHVCDALWPEFSAWNLMYAVFCYQHHLNHLKKLSVLNNKTKCTAEADRFAETVHKERVFTLKKMCLDVGVMDDINDIDKLTPEEIYQYYKQHIANTL